MISQTMKNNQKGFTLIELLIVIAIIAILASVVFVALNPLKRFRDARDSHRWTDVDALLAAIKLYQVDNNGSNFTAVTTACNNTAKVYAIYDTNAPTTPTTQNANCTTAVTDDADKLDFSGLETAGYISGVPVSPNGDGTWGTTTSTFTGYTIQCSASGAVTVRACENEGTSEIKLRR